MLSDVAVRTVYACRHIFPALTFLSHFEPILQRTRRPAEAVPTSIAMADFKSPLALGFYIVYTACGHKAVEQLLRSVTSLILLTTLGQPDVQPINIHIISDGGVSPEGLPRSSNVRYSVHQPMQATELFLPCSTQRLYLHEHPDFLELDRVLYVDMDTLWVGPPHFVWQQFDAMDAGGALFGMTEESSNMNEKGNHYIKGWSGQLPIFGTRGLAAGVLLLSLERVRSADFSKERERIIEHHHPRGELPLGDQDVLNAYANRYPHAVHVLPCTMNLRRDSACYEGFPIILHGNMGIYNNNDTSYAYLYNVVGAVQNLYMMGPGSS